MFPCSHWLNRFQFDPHLKEADENLNLAHNSQTQILAQEAAGEDLDLGFIFIHGQDHLMTTLLLKELIVDFIELYKNQYKED